MTRTAANPRIAIGLAAPESQPGGLESVRSTMELIETRATASAIRSDNAVAST